MTDDLDDLKKLMDTATPPADATRRLDNITLAQKNFETLQGSREGLRPTSDRPKPGFMSGVKIMLNTLTSRAGLTATTALVAVGIVMLSPLGPDLLAPGTRLRAPETDLQRATIVTEPAEATLSDTTPPETFAAQDTPRPNPAPTPMAKQVSPADSALVGRLVAEPPLHLDAPNTETFANADSAPLQITAENPVSTFSIDVDTASYAVIRNSLTQGRLPPADAVRIEEMINYFPYEYPTPDAKAAFRPTVTVTQTPWNPDTQLLQIGIQGAMPALADRPPLNLVFLIDTSGSMKQSNKLPLLKQSFRLMLGQLRPEDQIAIVTYAGSAGQVLAPTAAADRQTILNALDRLEGGGSTAGQAGLQQAYATAAEMADDGDVTRVILATDGDFNVGLSDPDALKTYIEKKRDSGTYLSVLGFGRGNLDDATMQALAQNGNGTAAYIDTLSEAQKVLVDQLSGALFPIANDVKIQVEFNPATVAEYRLIGYETRALRREDFNNDHVDAGDIGAGHQVTALYEATPTGSPAQLSDPLRYAAVEDATNSSDELAFLRLRFKTPGVQTSQLIEVPIAASPSAQTGFASAVAGFGQLLRGGAYLGDWGYADAIALANATKGDDPFGYRAEAIRLMRLAASLSAD